jgi:hypothetical protein
MFVFVIIAKVRYSLIFSTEVFEMNIILRN